MFSPPSTLPRADKEKEAVIDKEVHTLLVKEAVEVIQDKSPGFYGRIFVVPKRSGGYRPVLDLSSLNVFLKRIRFRMETPVSVRESIRAGDWASSIDLTDAYFHLLMHPKDRRWLRFVWKGTVYQFRALPFGLSLAPLIFTKVTKELASLARSEGIRLRVYLDDWLVLAQSESLCLRHTQRVLRLAVRLGFTPNEAKSELTPSQSFTYLGMCIDSVSMTVRPTPGRVERLQDKLQMLSTASSASAVELASLMGSMESMANLLPLGRVHKREFQRDFRLRRSQQASWQTQIAIADWFTESVTQWSDSA